MYLHSFRQYKAAIAYAVAKPGDVTAIQREIMAHGPVQVGFQVFSDFMTYKVSLVHIMHASTFTFTINSIY